MYEGALIFATRSRDTGHFHVLSHHFSPVHFLADMAAAIFDYRLDSEDLPVIFSEPEKFDLVCLGRFNGEGEFVRFWIEPMIDFADFVTYCKTDESPHVLDWLTSRGLFKDSVELAKDLGLVNKKKEN